MLFNMFFNIFCLIVFSKSQGQTTPQDPNEICSSSQQDCKSCIIAHPLCSWCSDPDRGQGCRRCRILSENEKLCNSSFLQNPQSSSQPTLDLSFNDPNPNSQEGVVQMKPQEVTINLRPEHPQKLNLTFQRVSDNPLDLYYVMDLSYSMKDDLQTLQNLGTTLPEEIKKISNNARLGFGSFVDKVISPFGNVKKLDNPCAGVADCSPSFGFRHQLPVTSDENLFSNVVRRTAVSGNMDSPEGGFDALMQIALCSNDIAWRDNSLKVVLFATDASPHIAMDGKLLNIYEKCDEECHLQSELSPYYPNDLIYTRSKQLDYPSVGQLKKVLERNGIQVIFAVTQNVFSLYENLVSVLGINAVVKKLAFDSSNIIDVISTSYNTLRYRAGLTPPTQLPNNIKLFYRVLCPRTNWVDDSLFCNQVLSNEKAVFELTFETSSCSNQGEVLTFSSTTSVDRTVVTLNYECNCPCMDEFRTNSSMCNQQGDFMCGQCLCNSNYTGQSCECEATSLNIRLGCIPTNQSSVNEACSGHGCCECGNCICDENYFGDFCECISTGCPQIDGKSCGGEDRGVCMNCNNNPMCSCNTTGGWRINEQSGLCSCNENLCKLRQNEPLCSGHGDCNCDTCFCSAAVNNHPLYSGPFCERCIHPHCAIPSGNCSNTVIKECAICVHEQDRLNKNVFFECESLCLQQNVFYRVLPELPDCDVCDETDQSSSCSICETINTDPNLYSPQTCSVDSSFENCKLWYQIAWETNDLRFSVNVRKFVQEQDCFNVDILPIVIGITVGIILIGLLLLCVWKALQTARDKREYLLFLNESSKKKKWQVDNPLFQQPVVRTMNPKYDGDSPPPIKRGVR